MPTPPPFSYASETRGAAMLPCTPNPIDLVEVPDANIVKDAQGNISLKFWDIPAGAWRTTHPIDARAAVAAGTGSWTEV